MKLKQINEYPKELKITQTCTVDGKTRTGFQVVKNFKAEMILRQQAASMEPNFVNEITEVSRGAMV